MPMTPGYCARKLSEGISKSNFKFLIEDSMPITTGSLPKLTQGARKMKKATKKKTIPNPYKGKTKKGCK